MSFNKMMERLNADGAGEAILNQVKTAYQADPTYWNPTLDAKGTATALLRILPAPDGESAEFAKYFSHYIQGGGKAKYIERCRSTLNEPDPAQELAQRKTGQGEKADKEWYRKYGRSARYVCNVLVLQDPNKPENNGKVFKYEFGNKIMGKIEIAMKGTEDPIDPKKPINVVHPLKGANLKLVVAKQGENKNYDNSMFMPESALFEGNLKAFEEVWAKAYKLQPLVAAETFKSYDELRKLLGSVVGEALLNAGGTATAAAVAQTGSTESAQTTVSTVSAGTSDEQDPDKVFSSLVKGTEQALSADAAVDALFDTSAK